MFAKLELEMQNPMIQHATPISDKTVVDEEEGIYKRTVIFKSSFNHMVILQSEDDGTTEHFTGLVVPRQMIPDVVEGFKGVSEDDPY